MHGLSKPLKKALLLKSEVTFEQLVDIALRLEEAERDSDGEAQVEKRGFFAKK